MTVVLIPIVATHGADGVLVVGILAGLMLLVLAVTGAGRAMKYMPLPVVEGFTAGIAVIIALQQLPATLGVEGPLFFGAAHDFLLELAEVSWVKVVVLRMRYVTTIDATGARLHVARIQHEESDGAPTAPRSGQHDE